jgi:hypothetical protein
MGEIYDNTRSNTERIVNDITANNAIKQTQDTLARVSSGVTDMLAIAGKAVVLTLSSAWMGIGLVKPARTIKLPPLAGTFVRAKLDVIANGYQTDSETPQVDRYDTEQLWSVKFGDYYMPLSQTYTISASKRLNTSSLVDGVDIIQQVRKEAKTVDCVLKISVNEKHYPLQIMTSPDGDLVEVAALQTMLSALYEQDTVFEIENATINDTFGITHAIMSKYKFVPRPASKTFIFEFSLTEVKYGANVLTFDEEMLNDDADTTSP